MLHKEEIIGYLIRIEGIKKEFKSKKNTLEFNKKLAE